MKERMTLEERFWTKVDKSGDCWLWRSSRTPKGYGTFKLGPRGMGWARAHRMAYILAFGNIPDGLFVLHKCDTPPCVNPSHLFLGTQADNIKDCIAKGRRNNVGKGSRQPRAKQSFCKRGHALSGTNLYLKPNGKRNCRQCARIHFKAFQLRLTHKESK